MLVICMHIAWRAEYSQKCTPHPMGPVCGRQEASRSLVGRCLALCSACPVALWQAFGTVKTLVLAVGRAINDRLGAGSVAARALVMKKPSRPYRAARQSKTLDSGHPLLVSLTLEHAVEGAPGELGAFDAGGHV